MVFIACVDAKLNLCNDSSCVSKRQQIASRAAARLRLSVVPRSKERSFAKSSSLNSARQVWDVLFSLALFSMELSNAMYACLNCSDGAEWTANPAFKRGSWCGGLSSEPVSHACKDVAWAGRLHQRRVHVVGKPCHSKGGVSSVVLNVPPYVCGLGPQFLTHWRQSLLYLFTMGMETCVQCTTGV